MHKTTDTLHRFWVVSAWKRRAVQVRAHYTREHVWRSIAPKWKGARAIFLQSLYKPTSTIRSFHERPETLHHFWEGPPRKREIHQNSHFRQSLEGSEIFWGTKFKNCSLPFCATVISLRTWISTAPYYATQVHAFVSSEAHNAKMPKFSDIWDHPLAASRKRGDCDVAVC